MKKREMNVSFRTTLGFPKEILYFAFKFSRGDRMIPPVKGWRKSIVF